MQWGRQALPSTRAHCPLGGQHKGTRQRRQLCPAHYKGRAQICALESRRRKCCPALHKGSIGLTKEENQRKNAYDACYKSRTRNKKEARN
ncbi:uncharacterized protein DS421_1g17420 [Arachis hypogaea]|nr:uncharacterized protein DS421_1g17420 [Arachis hypogaea]